MMRERFPLLTSGCRDVSFFFAIVIGSIVAGTACGPATDQPEAVDDAGRAIPVNLAPARIVSLSPPATELLFALGMGDRLVGRTRFDTYPAAALRVTDVGDAFPPNIEAIVAREPDLVVAYHSESNAPVFERLESAGIRTLSIRMDLLESVPRAARWLGRVIGEPHVADSFADAFETELRAATPPIRTPGLVGMVVVWDNPPMVIGGASFLHELIEHAGARNAFGDLDQPSPTVSIESITMADPDFILVTGDTIPAFAERPEWRAVRAVRARRFVLMDGTEFSWPSPRAPDAIRYLRRHLATLDTVRTR